MRDRSRRPRTALLCGVAVFALLQVGLLAAIETCLPVLRDPFYVHKAARLRARVAAPQRPYTIVMLGSSRTTFGLRGGEVEKSLEQTTGRPVALFNFGLTGAGPLLQLLALQRLRAEGVHPDLLLIEVLPPLFNAHRPGNEGTRLNPERLWRHELTVVARHGATGRELRRAWWSCCALPWYAYRYAILSHVAPAVLSYQVRQDWFRHVDGCGWVDPPYRAPTPESRRRGATQARNEYTALLRDFRLGGAAPAALRELLEVCRQQGIPAALVWMPEGTEFRVLYTPAARAQIDAFLADVTCTYGVPLIDAREWVADEDFIDSHHLLPAGAAKFSARLGREVLPALIR